MKVLYICPSSKHLSAKRQSIRPWSANTVYRLYLLCHGWKCCWWIPGPSEQPEANHPLPWWNWGQRDAFSIQGADTHQQILQNHNLGSFCVKVFVCKILGNANFCISRYTYSCAQLFTMCFKNILRLVSAVIGNYEIFFTAYISSGEASMGTVGLM